METLSKGQVTTGVEGGGRGGGGGVCLLFWPSPCKYTPTKLLAGTNCSHGTQPGIIQVPAALK